MTVSFVKFYCFLLSLVFTLPLLAPLSAWAQSIDQTAVREESLSRESRSDLGLVLSPESAQELLAGGAPRLVLWLAGQILNRGGAPELVAEWSQLKIAALHALDRHAEVMAVFEGLPPYFVESQPEFRLLIAGSQLAEKKYSDARENYSEFMLRYPDHPKNYIARRGLGLTALANGATVEAELLLDLYAQDSQRPNPDPLLLAALGQLAHLKGDSVTADEFFTQLAAAPPPAGWSYHRQHIEVLALWHVRNNRWQQAFTLVEEGLQNYPSPRFRRFYQNLLKKGLQVYQAKKKVVNNSILPAIQTLLRGGASMAKREAALDLLLARELNKPLGLFEEGGLLAPGPFLSYPLDPQLRLLLVKANLQLQNRVGNWWLIENIHGLEADKLRLRMLAAGVQPKEIDPIRELQKPIIMEGEMVKEVVAALFAFTSRRQLSPAAQLRRLLAPLSKDIAIRRALRYQEAMDRANNGEENSAITLFIELATDKPHTPNSIDPNALLPQPPAHAAAAILESQGATQEAAELRKIP